MKSIFGLFDRKKADFWLLIAAMCTPLFGEDNGVTWDMTVLSQPPQIYAVPDYPADQAKPLFYEALPYQEKPTRVFAWYGTPALEKGRKVPAMVLVHGGGGTAFLEWVKIWNQRGYAAIAMDLNGTMPINPNIPHNDHDPKGRPSHEWAGPSHTNALVGNPVDPKNHWVYHAVADIVLAHSLLRSMPEVDAGHIGLTGISWGGFLTSIVASVDDRFEFAIPVYGCGFLQDGPAWKGSLDAAPQEQAQLWLKTLDPSNFVNQIHIPTLWVNGDNDPFYPLSIHSRTFAQAGGSKNLAILHRLGHSHPDGWEPKEIYAYANSFSLCSPAPASVMRSGVSANEAWATFHSVLPVESAELYSTTDTTDWVKCEWKSTPASIDPNAWKISAPLPPDAKACFLNLKDTRGLIVSSPVMLIQP